MSEKLNQECNDSIVLFSNLLDSLRIEKYTYSYRSNSCSCEKELLHLKDLSKLIDIYSLVTICHLDLITNSKYLVLAKSNWEKIFF